MPRIVLEAKEILEKFGDKKTNMSNQTFRNAFWTVYLGDAQEGPCMAGCRATIYKKPGIAGFECGHLESKASIPKYGTLLLL